MKWLITRSSEEIKAWQEDLNENGIELTGVSFLDFKMVPIYDFPDCDWVFFTSKNGVKYFFDQWNKAISCKIAAIGKATAAAIESRSHLADFVPDGHLDSALAEFNKIATDQSVVWVKALNSAMSVTEKLTEVSSIIPVVVYENKISPKQLNETFDGIIFTSPMNAEAFLKSNKINQGSRIISIGPTTSTYLLEQGIEEFHEMELPEMKYIVNYIKSLNESNP